MGGNPKGSSHLIIRPAIVDDADSLTLLLEQLGYPSDTERVRRRLVRLFEDPSSYVLVAMIGADVVGVAALHVTPLLEHDQSAGQLIALCVDIRHRRKGIGRALINAVEQEATQIGCDAVVLNTGEHREAAHDFYRALGYASTGRRFVKSLEDSAT